VGISTDATAEKVGTFVLAYAAHSCISNKVSPHCGSYSHCCWLDWLLLVLGSDSMCPLMSVIISVISHYNETNFYSGFFFFKTEALHEHNIQDACLWYGTNENKIHEFISLPTL
jgi:hypothetical protein